MKNIILHNYHINFEDEAKEVEIYLESHLNLDEFKTLFNHAHLHQRAYFQDRIGHHYEIEYKNEEYFIDKK